MAERIRTILTVLMIAFAIWLFAEAESLGQYPGSARVRFVIPAAGTPVIAVVDDSFDGRVDLEVEGSQSAIRRFRQLLSDDFRFEPGDPGMPPGRGELRVNLVDAIEAFAQRNSARVTVLTASPTFVNVQIEDLVEHDVPVRLAFPDDVTVEGEPVVTPPTVRVAGPSGLLDPPPAAITLQVARDQLQDAILEGAVQTISVPVMLPRELIEGGATTLTTAVSAKITIRGTIESKTWEDIPVQVLLPSIEDGRWPRIAAEDRLISAEVRGPSEEIAALEQPGVALLAVIALTSDELEQGITEKPVFIVRRNADGRLVRLAETVTVTPSVGAVQFEIIDRGATDAP